MSNLNFHEFSKIVSGAGLLGAIFGLGLSLFTVIAGGDFFYNPWFPFAVVGAGAFVLFRIFTIVTIKE